MEKLELYLLNFYLCKKFPDTHIFFEVVLIKLYIFYEANKAMFGDGVHDPSIISSAE